MSSNENDPNDPGNPKKPDSGEIEYQQISPELIEDFADYIEDFANEEGLDLKTLYGLLLSVVADVKDQLGPEADLVMEVDGSDELH